MEKIRTISLALRYYMRNIFKRTLDWAEERHRRITSNADISIDFECRRTNAAMAYVGLYRERFLPTNNQIRHRFTGIVFPE